MSNVSGLFKDLTTEKKPETEDLPAGIREVRIRIIGKSRQARQSLLEKWKDLDVSHISG